MRTLFRALAQQTRSDERAIRYGVLALLLLVAAVSLFKVVMT